MIDSVEYPDVLGAVTGGTRVAMGVMQFALALTTDVIAAGRASEAILLVQNASDHKVEIAALLHLPDHDAKRQKGRFISRSARVAVPVQPGEVGYISLPFGVLPDTATSAPRARGSAGSVDQTDAMAATTPSAANIVTSESVWSRLP